MRHSKRQRASAAQACFRHFGTSPSRMARPALLALGLLVFIKASESFEVPALVGLPGSARVLTSTIYQRLTLDMPPDIGSASAFGVLLLVIMAILLQIYNRVAAQTHRYQTVTGKGYRPRVIRLGRWRYAAGALIVAIPFIVVVVPLATILWAALLPFYQPLSVKAAMSLLGFGNFVQVLNSPSFRGSIANSLILGASAATVVTALAAIAGWCVARRVAGSRLLDVLAALPLVFPAIVLGLAFLEMFVHAGAGFMAACFRSSSCRSWPIFPTACATRSLASSRSTPSSKRPPPSPAPVRRGDFLPHRLAAAGPCNDLVLAFRVSAGGARRIADASSGRAGFAGRCGGPVRFLEQRADRRTRRARLYLDGHHDGFSVAFLDRCSPLSAAHRMKRSAGVT